MSRNEWEEGKFKLSAVEFRKLSNSFYEKLNALREADRQTLTSVRTAVMVAAKGKRGVDWVALFDAEIEKSRPRPDLSGYGSSFNTRTHALNTIDEFQAKTLLVTEYDEKTRKWTSHSPRSVKKGDFSSVSVRSMPTVRMPDATILFDPKKRTVLWSVEENNHACDRARENPVAKAFFSLLGAVSWTRGTGGEIVGNDEYNQDSRDGGGGGNYSKLNYGPQTKKTQKKTLWRT